MSGSSTSPSVNRSERAAGWKVAFLLHEFPVISETFVATLAAALIPCVGEFRILTTAARPGAPPHQPIVAQAALLDRLHPARRDRRSETRRLIDLTRAAPGKGAALLALALLGQIAPRRAAVARMLASQPDFDVVHCQFGYAGLTALRHRRLGTLRTRALVVHFRGYDITRFVRDRGEHSYDRLFREADLFIANCAYFRQRAIDLGCPPDKITVIGSPIDTDRFRPPGRPRAAFGPRPLRLVAVGRLVAKKGFGDAIEAMARLGPLDARLDILGDGPLRPDLERRIAELGLADRVALHGAVTSDRILAALHAADIALAPSVTAGNGDADAPVNTLKEAMATELPVIATRHGGIPELVIPGENGALVAERDPDGLAAAIRYLAAHPERWSRLGAAGRAKVVEEYSLARVTAATLAAYATALDQRTARH